jgi:Na+/proline symporter
VTVGRVVTVISMIAASLLTYALSSARESFELLLSIGAGTGLLYLARWFWWRVNAWSEIAAMVSSFLVAVGFFIARKQGAPVASHVALLITVAVTTIVWVAATYLAPPTDRAKLVSFYKLVRPGGAGWKDVRAEAGVAAAPDSVAHAILGWVFGCLLVYSALFGIGSLVYGRTKQAAVWGVAFIISCVVVIRVLRAQGDDVINAG